MRTIKALMVAPMQTPKSISLETSIASFNRAVSIGADEELHVAAKRLGKCSYILYAPDAFFAGLEANRKVRGEIISGFFYVIAVDKKNQPVSLTDEQMERYMIRFYQPEHYENSEVLNNWSERLLKDLDDIAMEMTDFEQPSES